MTPLDMSYLDVAPGRWKWAIWSLFVLVALSYFAGVGLVMFLCVKRFGWAGGAIAMFLLFTLGSGVFRAGMAARRRRAEKRKD